MLRLHGNRYSIFIFYPSSGPLSFFLSPPFSSAAASFFLQHWIWFWICFLSALSLSISSLSPSLSWLCCHGYDIIPTWSASAEYGRRVESNLVRQNTSSSGVQASTDRHITCRSGRRTALREHECSGRRLFSSVMFWRIGQNMLICCESTNWWLLAA